MLPGCIADTARARCLPTPKNRAAGAVAPCSRAESSNKADGKGAGTKPQMLCPPLSCLQLRETIVSNSTGGELTIVVPNRGIWGTAGIDGSNIDGWVPCKMGCFGHTIACLIQLALPRTTRRCV